MRILLWHGYLLGGTGSNVYTRALAREWSRTGHDVVVLCQERHHELRPSSIRAARGKASASVSRPHLRQRFVVARSVFLIETRAGHR